MRRRGVPARRAATPFPGASVMGEPRDPRWPRPWGSQRAWRRRRRHRARAHVERVFPRQTALHRASGKELGERGLERDPSGVGRQRDRVLHISCLSSFCVFASTGSGAAAGAALQGNLPAGQGVGGRECPREVWRNELPSVHRSGRIFAAGRPHDAPNVASGREESGSCTQGGWGAHSSTTIVGGGGERAPANCNPPSAPTPSRPCALVGCGCEKEKKKVEPSHGTRHGSHTSRGAESPQLPPVHRVSALPTRDILSRAPLCRLVASCPSLGTPEAKTCSDRRNTFSAQPPLQAPLGPGFPS